MSTPARLRRSLSWSAPALVLCLPLSASRAHEGETPQHYVATSGEDVGECTSAEKPCRTIEYALRHAEKGDAVLVAEGSYRFREEDPAEMITLLSPIVQVRGGYSAEDGFAEQDAAANATVIAGAEADLAAPLSERGFVTVAQAQPDALQDTQADTLADVGTPRYVTETGTADGDCTTPDTACTLARALDVAVSGDSVLIADGSYVLSPDLADGLTRPDITIVGGVIEEAGFARPRGDGSATSYITGPSFEQRDALAARGLTLIQDRKGIAIEESRERAASRAAPAAEIGASECDALSGMAGPFPCRNVDLLATLPLGGFSSDPGAANDIWGFVDMRDEREYAIIGLLNGTAVVDVTDPESPREVGTIAGREAQWRDIKVYQFRSSDDEWQAYAYVTADNPVGGRQGLQIIDLSGLPTSVSLASTWNRIGRAHNVYISNVDYSTGVALPGMQPYVYIAGSDRNSGALLGLDVSDPTAPSEVLRPAPGTQYIHDGTSLVIEDARTASCLSGASPPPDGHSPCELFVDFNEDSLDLWDVTDKAQPLMISSTPYPDAHYTHSGWWSADKNFVFLQDELDEQDAGLNTTMRVFDISDLSAPVVSGIWTGPTRAIDHNSFTRGDKLYMSNYRRGLTILDVSDPNAPLESGFFDTFPSPSTDSAQFNGAWGVYPFLPSGTLVVSDIEGGLFVLRESTGESPAGDAAHAYAVKLVCGQVTDAEDAALVAGRYETLINIGNFGEEDARFSKRLALTLPPGGQQPGETDVFGEHELPPGQALKTDCRDIAERVFGGTLPGDLVEGFVVVRSDAALDVSAVYTAGGTGDGGAETVNGIDVENIGSRPLGRRD